MAEALFPAKVSEEEASKIAEGFIKKFIGGNDYRLEAGAASNEPRRTLTEPIQYSFIFTRIKDKVSIADQHIEVTVLGNGEISSFYKTLPLTKHSTFDELTKIKKPEELLKKMKTDLSAELNYQIHYDYVTGERDVRLVYQPASALLGIHAISGKWKTENGYTNEYPAAKKIEKLAAKPLPPRQNGITADAAKKLAEQLLATDSNEIKLIIESVQEIERPRGENIFSVQYMYQYANGGMGSSLDISKKTGEVIQFHSLQENIVREMGKENTNKKSISRQDATKKAISYIKKWAPSYLHQYAMPVADPYIDESTGSIHFSFPRAVNGILVSGDQINIGIAVDGSLTNLNIDYQDIEEWPAIEKAIPKVQATKIFKESLDLQLVYLKQKETEAHYDLVYVPVFNGNPQHYLDAGSGEWKNLFGDKSSNVISHPWAEAELNYLLNAKILDIKDVKKFNADAPVSRGEALKVLMNSLTYFYPGDHYFNQEQTPQTFENIGSKHPLYHVIEHAVELGVIKPDKNFDVESSITREEVAVWYIRILGLEQAAKESTIYKLNFTDANKVQPSLIGYVAIANSLGIMKAEKNLFHPGEDVNYAELASASIRLAHAMAESGRGF
ncbi:YcdB/YcdC domain-containing protein [Sporosarcina sp.]|uniref:YcdB/YcdC domain-containing protein n=1 Tax=Sporosarcina sp. TaxID=49982 RepID=UPI002615E265|nr:YcdB/YcdC domain-containing protein [Sporosarcina sp.]